MTQKIWDLRNKVNEGEYKQFYFVKNNVLFGSIVDNGHKFEARVIPESLRDVVLHLGPQSVRTQWIPKGHTLLSSVCTTGRV